MKKRFIAAACLTLLGACGQPQVDVKGRWNRAMSQYSFVPLYPARGDVMIGDIRIHRIKGAAEALDSRLVSRGSENKFGAPKSLPYSDAVLPGIEAFRLMSLDTESIGLSGFVRRLLGSRIDASSTLYVSLQKLQTREVSDVKVAGKFYEHIRDKTEVDPANNGQETEFIWGLCAAAKTLGNPSFDDIGISVVTRVIHARRIAYYSGEGISNVPEQAKPQPDPKATAEQAGSSAKPNDAKNAQGNSFTFTTGSRIPAQDLENPVVVGVDALMLNPLKVIGVLDGKGEPQKGTTIADRCKSIMPFFATSRLGVLSNIRRKSKGR